MQVDACARVEPEPEFDTADWLKIALKESMLDDFSGKLQSSGRPRAK